MIGLSVFGDDGSIELHRRFGTEYIPIPEGAWSVEQVFDAYDLHERLGCRVRVLRRDPEEASVMVCVAQFLPEGDQEVRA